MGVHNQEMGAELLAPSAPIFLGSELPFRSVTGSELPSRGFTGSETSSLSLE